MPDLSVFRREQLESGDPQMIGGAVVHQLQRTHGAINAWAETEHDENGRHTDITADSVTTRGNVNVGGDALVDGDGRFKKDVIARADTNGECGLGELPTIQGAAFMPGEIGRHGLLLAGPNGFWIERRPAGFPPFDPNPPEICFWNLAQSAVQPSMRLGVFGGVPTLIDGGSGALLNVGCQLERMNEVHASRFYALGRGVEQGTWIDQPFNAADFTATPGPATWVPNAGFHTRTYTLIGRTMLISFELNLTTVTGAPVRLNMTLPPGASVSVRPFCGFVNWLQTAGGGNGTGFIEASPGNTFISLIRDIIGTAWPASAATLYVRGSIQFEVAGI